MNKFMQKWVNESHSRQKLYEATFLSRLFPAHFLYITLIK
jgi:hypothetical protein